MRRLLAAFVVALASAAAWAQMPNRGTWMAGWHDGGGGVSIVSIGTAKITRTKKE